MPAFWVGLAWFLGVYTTKLIYRVMAAIGIGFVTYTGLEWALDQIETEIQGRFGSMTQYMVDTITLLQLDQAMSIVLSAYAAVAFLSASKILLSKINS